MAKCGIKRYDELPGRVGWTDVDAMRANLAYSMKKVNKFVKKVNYLKDRLETERNKWQEKKK